MKNIKTYEDFVNEEINLRKGLMGAAMAASLMGGMTSCNKEDIKPNTEQTIQDNILVGNWTTSFQFNAGNYNEVFSCKITFKSNGDYIITERVTSGHSYPSLVKGKYKIIDNYTYANNQGTGKALVLIPSDGSPENYLKIVEVESDYRYDLIREPHTPSMQQALGAESPTSINSIFVPDLTITKQF
jgi:hypothetical protein